MGKFFGQEKISKFVKVSNNIARLNSGSFVVLGGQAYDLGQLDLDASIIGAGGMESARIAASLYYVYVVQESGDFKLIASLSSEKPTNFDIYRKVGAFSTDFDNTDISDVYFFGSQQETRSKQKIMQNDIVNSNVSNITDLRFDNLKSSRTYFCHLLIQIVFGASSNIYTRVSHGVATTDRCISFQRAYDGASSPEDRERFEIQSKRFNPSSNFLNVEHSYGGAITLEGNGLSTETNLTLYEVLELDWTI